MNEPHSEPDPLPLWLPENIAPQPSGLRPPGRRMSAQSPWWHRRYSTRSLLFHPDADESAAIAATVEHRDSLEDTGPTHIPGVLSRRFHKKDVPKRFPRFQEPNPAPGGSPNRYKPIPWPRRRGHRL